MRSRPGQLGARGKRPSLSLQILVAAAWPPPILSQSSKIDMGDRGLELLSPKFPSEESNVTQNIFLHSYPPLCLVSRAGGFSCIYNNALKMLNVASLMILDCMD